MVAWIFFIPLCLDAKQLSPEGIARRDAHAFLFNEFSRQRETEMTGPPERRILKSIRVSDTPVTFESTSFELELPRGSERILGMFRYLVLKGEHLDKLGGLKLSPYGREGHMHRSKQEPNLYRVQVGAMPIPSGNMEPVVVKSKIAKGAKVVVQEVWFDSQSRLPVQFDDLAYRNLGAELPLETVAINLDVDHTLIIGASDELQRDRWFRFYGIAGRAPEWLEKFAADNNWIPGRQILKFQPALVKGYSPNQPKLQEQSGKPGYADLSFFEKYEFTQPRSLPSLKAADYAMCFNDWPKFMSLHPNGRGTPKRHLFEAAARLAAIYVKNEKEKAGRTATWWEVKNESTIKAEWDYHWRKDVDSWKLLADFHNQVATEIKKESPETRVGGPSSAWMQVQASNFGLYEKQRLFMDRTRDALDFYSHHFYENIGSLGAPYRETTYTNYLMGRLETILDMFVAHMDGTQNRKPILITECGSLQPGRGASDYWLRIRSYNGYLIKFMQRPDQVRMMVPFAFLHVPWDPMSGNAAFIPAEGKANLSGPRRYQRTPVADFFEFWKDFDGRRLHVSNEIPLLDTVSVLDGDELHVAINNMSQRRRRVRLAGLEGLKIKAIVQKRLYYHDGEIKTTTSLIPVEREGPAVNVHVGETTLVTIQLQTPHRPASSRSLKRYYSGKTAIQTNKQPTPFTIQGPGPDVNVTQATLVVGVARQGGLDNGITLSFNSTKMDGVKPPTNQHQHLFDSVRIPLQVEQVKSTNELVVQPLPGMRVTSAHLEIVETR